MVKADGNRICNPGTRRHVKNPSLHNARGSSRGGKLRGDLA